LASEERNQKDIYSPGTILSVRNISFVPQHLPLYTHLFQLCQGSNPQTWSQRILACH